MGKVTVPFIGMIIAECVQVALIILSKQVMSQVSYSFSIQIQSLLLFFFHLPSSSIDFNVLQSLFQLFLLSSYLDYLGKFHSSIHLSFFVLLLCLFIANNYNITFFIFSYFAQVFGYAGINYSSSTLATAMLNLVPGFTFILAVLFRMEQLDWRSSSSLAKSLGTIVSIAGAFIATLYKGVAILKGPSPANLSQQPLFSQDFNWILGGLFLAADCVMASSFLIVQASILKKYPAGLIVVFFYCFFVAILSGVTCLVVERDISAWSLEPKLRLLSVLYSGIFGSAVQVGVTTWCLHQTGPVFVSMFKPIGIVISVVISVVFLGDAFYLGSLIGATVIVIGFYSVLWGKSKDIEARSLESSGNQTPLLKENISEDI